MRCTVISKAIITASKLTRFVHEKQIYRIDHYLGKETVQNILMFRFSNAIFEHLWNRQMVDHFQITVSEKLGVGSRGGYYEEAGALRDMVQNHLLLLAAAETVEQIAAWLSQPAEIVQTVLWSGLATGLGLATLHLLTSRSVVQQASSRLSATCRCVPSANQL